MTLAVNPKKGCEFITAFHLIRQEMLIEPSGVVSFFMNLLCLYNPGLSKSAITS
jgi:hypothetical protein